MADYAKEKGVNIAVEPINRYESYVCNTAENVLELIEKAGKDNLFLHLDTFHMNIEENNFRHHYFISKSKVETHSRYRISQRYAWRRNCKLESVF